MKKYKWLGGRVMKKYEWLGLRGSTWFLLAGMALIAWGGLWLFQTSNPGLMILNTFTVASGFYTCIMAGKLRAYEDDT